MKFKVQVVTLTDDGEESMREVACVERDDLTPRQPWPIDCGQ